jgi:hypothetical protein
MVVDNHVNKKNVDNKEEIERRKVNEGPARNVYWKVVQEGNLMSGVFVFTVSMQRMCLGSFLICNSGPSLRG